MDECETKADVVGVNSVEERQKQRGSGSVGGDSFHGAIQSEKKSPQDVDGIHEMENILTGFFLV